MGKLLFKRFRKPRATRSGTQSPRIGKFRKFFASGFARGLIALAGVSSFPAIFFLFSEEPQTHKTRFLLECQRELPYHVNFGDDLRLSDPDCNRFICTTKLPDGKEECRFAKKEEIEEVLSQENWRQNKEAFRFISPFVCLIVFAGLFHYSYSVNSSNEKKQKDWEFLLPLKESLKDPKDLERMAEIFEGIQRAWIPKKLSNQEILVFLDRYLSLMEGAGAYEKGKALELYNHTLDRLQQRTRFKGNFEQLRKKGIPMPKRRPGKPKHSRIGKFRTLKHAQKR